MAITHQTELEQSGHDWGAKMDKTLSDAEQLHKKKMTELEQQYQAKLESVRQETQAHWEERVVHERSSRHRGRRLTKVKGHKYKHSLKTIKLFYRNSVNSPLRWVQRSTPLKMSFLKQKRKL